MRAAILLMLLVAPAAAAEPSLNDIVARAREVANKKPQQAIVCHVVVDTQLLDRHGKAEHDEHREGHATFKGDDTDIVSEKVVRDGRALTADEIAEEHQKVEKDKARNKKKKGSGEDFDMSPFAPQNFANESFTLVRKDTLWGHPVYVLAVKAQKTGTSQANGTLWIDGDSFVELKGELSPSEMPEHADWIKVQEQFERGPHDVALPTFLHIEGAGHMLFMHKQFRTTLHWSDCH